MEQRETQEQVTIPEEGRDKETLLDEMRAMRDGDADWRGGRTFSLVYYAGEEHHDFVKTAHNLYFTENGLNPLAFKSLKRMETEVVRMTADMLHGDATTVGTMTSGGTESILLAVKSARERARKLKPWILQPEIVAPRTIHVAFEKAAHYFGLKIRYADIGEDCRVDVRSLKKKIGLNTVLIAASAPQYPHGVVDPIEEIAEIARDKGIPFHVDACIGGFVLPWVEALGYPVPLWDFRVDGVTSISADVHKYGFAAKGASVLVYRSMDYLKHQFFVATDWPGGIYASPSIPGTRPGGCISAAWASLQAMGRQGFIDHTRAAMEVRERLLEGVAAIDGIEVIGGVPHATIVAMVTSEGSGLDIYAIADQLEARGWNVDRQQYPPSLHCTCTSNHKKVIEAYIEDLEASVEHVRQNPELAASGNAAMYGMMAKVPFRGLIKHSILKVMEGLYGPDGKVPDLSKLGEDEEDGLLLAAINKYGDQAMDVLQKLEDGRDRIKHALGHAAARVNPFGGQD